MDAVPRPMLICDAGPVRFALALAEVREILPAMPLWRPPTMPRPLAGFVAVRGETVAVLSTAALFDGDAAVPDRIDLYAHMVRVRAGGDADACLLVDRAAAVATATVQPVPDDASWNGCAVGLVPVDGGTVHLVSVARLLAGGAAQRVAALTADAARRRAEWAA